MFSTTSASAQRAGGAFQIGLAQQQRVVTGFGLWRDRKQTCASVSGYYQCIECFTFNLLNTAAKVCSPDSATGGTGGKPALPFREFVNIN
jgi:hypothetical protein